MMYDWLFTPDDADIAASNGYDLGVRGGEAFKTESRAIWHHIPHLMFLWVRSRFQ